MFGKKGIVLDPGLLERAKQAAAKAGYASVDEYVSHLVERALSDGDEKGVDAADIKKKLEGLGYIS